MAVNMQALKQCILLLVVYSQLVVLNGKPTDELEEHGRGQSEISRQRQLSSQEQTTASATPTVVLAASIVSGSGTGFSALALYRDELFTASPEVEYISVYNTSSMTLQRRINSPGLRAWQSGLAVCPFNRYLYVSEYYGRCVHRVDLSTNDVITWSVTGRPIGLSVNSERNVIVVFRGSIEEHTSDGTLLRQTTFDSLITHAVGTSHGTLIVSRDSPRNIIEELSREGDVVRSYRLGSPRSFVIDSSGFIIGAGRSTDREPVLEELQVFNPSMTTIRSLLLPITIDALSTRPRTSMWLPPSMSYDEQRGRLFIGEVVGRNRLLVFDHVSNLGALFS